MFLRTEARLPLINTNIMLRAETSNNINNKHVDNNKDSIFVSISFHTKVSLHERKSAWRYYFIQVKLVRSTTSFLSSSFLLKLSTFTPFVFGRIVEQFHQFHQILKYKHFTSPEVVEVVVLLSPLEHTLL